MKSEKYGLDIVILYRKVLSYIAVCQEALLLTLDILIKDRSLLTIFLELKRFCLPESDIFVCSECDEIVGFLLQSEE